MFCRSLFVLLSFFFWSLCCLFFHLRILITPLVSSKSSYSNMESTCVFRVSILSQFLRFASCILELFWRRGFSCYFCFFICLFVCFHFIVACMVVVCFLATLWPFILAQRFGRMSSLHVWQCFLSTCVAISSGSTQSQLLFRPRMIVCSRSRVDLCFHSQCGCVFLRHVWSCVITHHYELT